MVFLISARAGGTRCGMLAGNSVKNGHQNWGQVSRQWNLAPEPPSEHNPTGTEHNGGQLNEMEYSTKVVYSRSDQDFGDDEDTVGSGKDRKEVKWKRSEGKSPELISDYCVLRHKVVLLDRMRWG